MDRFSIIIERQEQIEELIREWGFLPFFKNGIEGFSIEEMTSPELLFGDEFNNGPWGWKGPIIANWESAYGKYFKGKAGFVSLEWLPDFMNWRRSIYPLKKMDKDAKHIYKVLVENESMITRQLKKACGFTLSRKRKTFNPDDPATPVENPKNGMAFESLIAGIGNGHTRLHRRFRISHIKERGTIRLGIDQILHARSDVPRPLPYQRESGRSNTQTIKKTNTRPSVPGVSGYRKK